MIPEQQTLANEESWFRMFNKSDLLGMAIIIGIVLLAFFEVIFMGKTFSVAPATVGTNGFDPPTGYVGMAGKTFFRIDPGASAWQFEPWAEVTNRILREGQVPLWNPYKGFGAPHAANMQSAVFDPLLLPVNLHPSPLAWDLAFLLALFIGALAMYLLCRLLGLRMPASVTGAGGFILSGFFVLYSNNQFFRSFIYLPVLFVLVELNVRARRWIVPAIGLGLAIAGNILIGMPEASFFVLTATAAYAAYRSLTKPKGLRFRIAVGRFAVSGLLGLALAAPLLLPFAQYEKYGHTTHSPSDQVGSRHDPDVNLIYWVIPYLNGPVPAIFVNPGGGPRNWTGMALAILVLVGFCSPSVMRNHKGWFFGGLGFVLLAKAYGFPWIQWLGKLPLMERVDFQLFSSPVIGFCLAVVGAIGTQSLLDGKLKRPRLAMSILLLATGVAWLLKENSQVVAAALEPMKIFFLPGNPTIRPFILTAGLASAATVAMVVILLLPRKVAGILAICVMFGELLLLMPRDVYFKRFDPYATPPWMKVISKGLKEEPYSRVFGLNAKLFPDTAGALGLFDIRSIDAIYPDRYVRYIQTFIEPEFVSRFVGGPFGQNQEQSLANIQGNRMFDLLGVRYILAGDSGKEIQNSFRSIGTVGGVQVFENIRRLPRALLVHKIHTVQTADQALAFLKGTGSRFPDGAIHVERFDPNKEAVVEVLNDRIIEEKINGEFIAGEPFHDDIVEFISYTANEVRIKVHTSQPALLLLTDTFFPGWDAKVNNVPTRILPTNIAFRGVPVNAGPSTVVFQYRPKPFRAGIVLAAFAALTITIMLLGGALAQRRCQLNEEGISYPN